MEVITIRQKLTSIPVFEDLDEEVIDWFLENAEEWSLNAGEQMFTPGDPIEHMTVILAGKIQFNIIIGGNLVPFGIVSTGDISGVLPYSRLTTARGYGEVLEDSFILRLHKSKFREMEQVSQELTSRLVAVMSDRVRDATRSEQQKEKMASLGKLAAGLAHEINNPAAAINRTASELQDKIRQIPRLTTSLMDHGITSEDLQRLNSMVYQRCNIGGTSRLSMMEKSEKEDELIDWMDEHEVENAFDLAESLLSAGIDVNDLQDLSKTVPPEAFSDILEWINCALAAEKLTVEVKEASNRISKLVDSVKTYSHMDRAPDMQPIDVHEGLDSTLVMLNHKLKGKNVEVARRYDEELPKVNAITSEINQVWTNLLDNAFDAIQKDGKVTIETVQEGNFAKIRIMDDGPGIPEDIQNKIFDPFFTTKEVGKGTGLGLDIVRRVIDAHNAEIKVKSQPGDTVFEVCIPLVK